MRVILIVFCIILVKLSLINSLDYASKHGLSGLSGNKRLLPHDVKIYHGESPKNSYSTRKSQAKRDILNAVVTKTHSKLAENKHKSLLFDLTGKREVKPGNCPNPKTNEYSFICGLYQCTSDVTCRGVEKCVSFQI